MPTKTEADPLLNALLSFAPFWKAVASRNDSHELHLCLLFSGGPDSVALALALREFAQLAAKPAGASKLIPLQLPKPELASARKFFARPNVVKVDLLHLNHGLRDEAAEEAKWVERFAAKHGCGCECRSAGIAEYAKDNALSVEEAGRIVRYMMLNERLEADPHALGFTAHNLNDNAESVLYALAQRTGISGMLGIAPMLHGRILRPLLALRKDEILAELKRLDAKYLTDETNLVPDRPRTFLRHKVVPLMQELNPRFLENTYATCDNIRGYEGLFRWALDTTTQIALAEVRHWRAELPLPLLPPMAWFAFAPSSWDENIRDAMHVVFHHLLRSFRVSLNWNEALELADAVRGGIPFSVEKPLGAAVEYQPPSGLLFIVHGGAHKPFTLREGESWIGGNQLHVAKLNKAALAEEMQALAEGEARAVFSQPPHVEGVLPYAALLASDAPMPLTVRAPKRGDKIQLANGGTAKLSDVFINMKVPQCLRASWPVAVNAAGEIVWLPGLTRGGADAVPSRAQSAWKLSWEAML
jgi:tRNA(Ile)-lysidine synthetase-like protein